MSPRTLRALATVALGLIVVVGGGAVVPSMAAEDDSADRPAVGLRVSPAVLEVPYEPGLSEHAIQVTNTGSQPVTLTTQLAEFTVGPDGTTTFTGPAEVAATSWVTVDTESFTLEPGDTHEVDVKVDVPADAEPGERYVSVVFGIPPPDDTEGNIPVTHQIATKLYIGVPGEQRHQLEFGTFTAPRLVDSSAATFTLEVHNRGNVHRRFEGETQLVATSGDAEIPFENFTVLGGASRVVEAVWADPPTVCWCQVSVTADDGQGNPISASTRVLIFPLRLTLAVLAVTVGLVLLMAARRRKQVARLQAQLENARREGMAASAAASPTSETTTPPRTESESPPNPHHDRTEADRSPSSPSDGLFTARGETRKRRR